MKRRRGFSLIESLGTITLLGAVWTTIALALHTLYDAERRMSRALDHENVVDQLAQRLRGDAHAAGSASLDATEDVSTLLLASSPTRQLRYRSVESGIERAVLVDDEIVHHEVFYLPIERARWQVQEQNQKHAVLLLLQLQDVRRRIEGEHEIKAAVGLIAPTVNVEVTQP